MKNNLHVLDFNAAMVPQYQEVIKNKPWVYDDINSSLT